MKKRVTRWTALAVMALILGIPCIVAVAPAAADTTVEERNTIPVDLVLFIDCLGEPVRVIGEIQVVHQVTFDDQGSARVVAYGVFPRAIVIGLTSGRIFSGKGAGFESLTVPTSALPHMFLLHARGFLISSDLTRMLRVNVTMQEIVYPDGNIDGFPIAIEVTCS